MKNHNELHDELRELSPLLHRLKREKEAGDIPPGYFSRMQEDVLRQVRQEAGQPGGGPVQLRPVWSRLLAPLAVAASVSLLVLAGWWMFRPQPHSHPSYTEVALPYEEAAAYVDANIDEFDLALLAGLYPEEEGPLSPAVELNDQELDELLEELELEDLEDFL